MIAFVVATATVPGEGKIPEESKFSFVFVLKGPRKELVMRRNNGIFLLTSLSLYFIRVVIFVAAVSASAASAIAVGIIFK